MIDFAIALTSDVRERKAQDDADSIEGITEFIKESRREEKVKNSATGSIVE